MLRNILANDELVSCEPDAKVFEVSQMMADRNVGAILVLTNGKPRGIITDRDIVVRCIAKNLDFNDTTIEQVMTETVESVKDTDGIYDCIQKMHDAKVRRMPVVDDDGNAVGMVSFGDLVSMLGKELSILAENTTTQTKPRLKAA